MWHRGSVSSYDMLQFAGIQLIMESKMGISYCERMSYALIYRC